MTGSPKRANAALTNLDDEHLAQALKRGQHEALTVLFERHSKCVFRISRRILGDDGEAEETVQDVFMEAYGRISQFDPARASFRTWLLINARCRAIDRKRRLQSAGVDKWVTIGNSTNCNDRPTYHLNRYSPGELKHFIGQLLTSLSPDEQEVIELHLYRDLTLEETSKEIGTPLHTVRHLYYGAVKKLHAALLSERPGLHAEAPQARKAGNNGHS